MNRTTAWLTGLTLGLGLMQATSANDGGIAFGGSPRLLSGQGTVSMQREVVRMTVGREIVKVDCQFVFQNSGRACTVRMGFPDQGRGTEDPDEVLDAAEMRKPPSGTFLSYVSYVDGVRVPTKVIRAAHPGNFWHAKNVRFAAHGIRHVHDIYTLPLGGQMADKGSQYRNTYYIVHTGASWHGLIGRSEVDITFLPGVLTGPLKPVAEATLKGRDLGAMDWAKVRPGTVYYSGPCPPTVHGSRLQFVRTRWRPAYRDDVLLSFGIVLHNTFLPGAPGRGPRNTDNG